MVFLTYVHKLLLENAIGILVVDSEFSFFLSVFVHTVGVLIIKIKRNFHYVIIGNYIPSGS